jgi:hypothetical protein
MRGVAPFFEADKFETYNYEGEIMKLLRGNHNKEKKSVKSKRRLH